MFKYLALSFFALLAVAAAKPSIISPFATYSTSLLASPITAGYTFPYSTYATAPYAAAAYAPYSPYSFQSPYYAAYSSYPYGSILLRK
ncbi:uncharacterized protein LOC118747017 [Rhagoletis pomonella]|uniref:uncharacterized protein LOC118747017 n=1 Tax=Rhagoletis pomonella TaxID=28610 RepID=UPI00177BDC8D|nr:uncharacterized protein LOC118747017 [Rhagoletis pomonella]